MFEPQSALGGATYEGCVSVSDAGCHGMITLRGDLQNKQLAEALKVATGHMIPEPRQVAGGLAGGAAWASPDELLLFMPRGAVDEAFAELYKILGESHFLAADVSDARAAFTLKGGGLRDVLAKLCPADVSPKALPIGEFRRSRLAQVAVAFWFENEELAHLICFRSVAVFAFDLLKTAADPGGELGFFTR